MNLPSSWGKLNPQWGRDGRGVRRESERISAAGCPAETAQCSGNVVDARQRGFLHFHYGRRRRITSWRSGHRPVGHHPPAPRKQGKKSHRHCTAHRARTSAVTQGNRRGSLAGAYGCLLTLLGPSLPHGHQRTEAVEPQLRFGCDLELACVDRGASFERDLDLSTENPKRAAPLTNRRSRRVRFLALHPIEGMSWPVFLGQLGWAERG
jgi:hypothetical protein